MGGTSGAARGGAVTAGGGAQSSGPPEGSGSSSRAVRSPSTPVMPGIDKLPIEEALEDSPQVGVAGRGPLKAHLWAPGLALLSSVPPHLSALLRAPLRAPWP